MAKFIAFAVLFVTLATNQFAFGILCGTPPTDPRLWAVCGLQHRTVAADENFWVKGSGVFVTWTQAGVTRYGIVSARHFIDQSMSHGNCVQENTWYAYFYLPECANWPPNGECIPMCFGVN